MKKALLILLLACGAAYGQQPNTFVAYKNTTLTASSEKVTVQSTANTGVATIRFLSATLYCSVACDWTLSQNGTAASATTLEVVGYNGAVGNAATAWSVSNVGTGTALYVYSLAAGTTLTVDLSTLYLGKATTQNLSFGTSSITGTARVGIVWQER